MAQSQCDHGNPAARFFAAEGPNGCVRGFIGRGDRPPRRTLRAHWATVARCAPADLLDKLMSFLPACRGGRGDQFLQNFDKRCRKTNSGHGVNQRQSNFFGRRNGLRKWLLRMERTVPSSLAIEQFKTCLARCERNYVPHFQIARHAGALMPPCESKRKAIHLPHRVVCAPDGILTRSCRKLLYSPCQPFIRPYFFIFLYSVTRLMPRAVAARLRQ